MVQGRPQTPQRPSHLSFLGPPKPGGQNRAATTCNGLYQFTAFGAVSTPLHHLPFAFFFFLITLQAFREQKPFLDEEAAMQPWGTGEGTAPAAQHIYCPCGTSQGSTMTLQLSTALLNDGN